MSAWELSEDLGHYLLSLTLSFMLFPGGTGAVNPDFSPVGGDGGENYNVSLWWGGGLLQCPPQRLL